MARPDWLNGNAEFQRMCTKPIEPPKLIDEIKALQLFTLAARGMRSFEGQVLMLVNLRPDLWHEASAVLASMIMRGDEIVRVSEEAARKAVKGE